MKYARLLINILASNDCLCHRNIFQNGVNTFSKMVKFVCQKAQTFVYFLPYDFVLMLPARGQDTKLFI